MKALLRTYEGSMKALWRLYEDSMQALLRAETVFAAGTRTGARKCPGQHVDILWLVRDASCIRQHTSAYVSIRHVDIVWLVRDASCIRQHMSAYVSIRQLTSAYVNIHHDCVMLTLLGQHTSAYASIRHVDILAFRLYSGSIQALLIELE
jgi:hypothetical protein